MLIRVIVTCFIVFILLDTINAVCMSDTIVTQSGLKYTILKESIGPKAQNGKIITAHYIGKFIDGKVFDSSYDRKQPIEFVLGAGRVIKGWEEGVLLMSVGDRYSFYIPYALAYGEEGNSIIPSKADLIFEIELINIQDPKPPILEEIADIIFYNGLDSAITYYRNLRDQKFNNFDFGQEQLSVLANQYFLLKDYASALKVYQLNLELYPSSSLIYKSMSDVYLKLDNAEKAKECLDKASKLESSEKQ